MNTVDRLNELFRFADLPAPGYTADIPISPYLDQLDKLFGICTTGGKLHGYFYDRNRNTVGRRLYKLEARMKKLRLQGRSVKRRYYFHLGREG